MKKLYLLLALTILMAMGCSKEVDEVQKPGDSTNTEEPVAPSVKIDAQLQVCQLDAKSTSAEVEFDINNDWEIHFVTYEGEPVNWIKATPSKGSAGKQVVKLQVDINNTADDRLVRLEVRNPMAVSRSMELDDVLVAAEATCLTISILQYGYYELVYGDPVEAKLSETLRLKEVVDTYIANHNQDYTDIVYLEIFGPMYDEDYQFIREQLPNITVLDLTAADITTIPINAFSHKKSLHYIKLPFSVRVIDDYAFYNSGIKNVNLYLPPLLKNVGWNAFAYTNIAGTIFITSEMYLEGGAFEGGITSVIACPGITTLEGDIVGAFGDGYVIYLPSTISSISPGMLDGATYVFCFATEPPKTDRYSIDNNIKALFIPVGTLEVYSNNMLQGPEYDSDWDQFYSENSKFNRMHEALSSMWF